MKNRGKEPTITTPYGCKSPTIASVKSILQFPQLHISRTHEKKPVAVFPFLQKGWDDQFIFRSNNKLHDIYIYHQVLPVKCSVATWSIQLPRVLHEGMF